MASDYLVQDVHALGITRGASWDDYPEMCPYLREVMRSTMTPTAFVAIYYNPSTFENIFKLISARFETVPIFRKEGNIFVEIGKRSSTAPYRHIFNVMKILLMRNLKTINDIISDKRDDSVGSGFQNLAFVTETRIKLAGASGKVLHKAASHRFDGLSSFIRPQYGGDVHATAVDGFFPYVSNRSEALGEIMFWFHHAKLRRPVLVTADDRESAVSFLRAHSTLHSFDKYCGVCGKTGGLLKCPCKRVRYCCAECQLADWPEHRGRCGA